jgi:hypothetical protein
MCHLANICTRTRKTITFDPVKEQIVGDAEAGAMVRRKYRDGHWAVPKGV